MCVSYVGESIYGVCVFFEPCQPITVIIISEQHTHTYTKNHCFLAMVRITIQVISTHYSEHSVSLSEMRENETDESESFPKDVHVSLSL